MDLLAICGAVDHDAQDQDGSSVCLFHAFLPTSLPRSRALSLSLSRIVVKLHRHVQT